MSQLILIFRICDINCQNCAVLQLSDRFAPIQAQHIILLCSHTVCSHICNAQALYGNPPAPPPTVGASSYPKPESIRWDSPVYADGSADDVLTTAATASDQVQ
jgi:hypothetical protein